MRLETRRRICYISQSVQSYLGHFFPEFISHFLYSGNIFRQILQAPNSAQWEERGGHVELEIFMSVCTQEDSVLKYQKIKPKFKHGPDRLGIKVEVPNNINFDLTCPK